MFSRNLCGDLLRRGQRVALDGPAAGGGELGGGAQGVVGSSGDAHAARRLRCRDRHLHRDRDRRPRADGARRPRAGPVLSRLRCRAARLEAHALARRSRPQNEIDDVAQMLEAQNERRRRRGLPDRTEEEIAAEVRRDHAELKERAAAFRAREEPGIAPGPDHRLRRARPGAGARARSRRAMRCAARRGIRRASTRSRRRARSRSSATPTASATLMEALYGVTVVVWLLGLGGRRARGRSCTPGGCGCCARSSSTRRCAGSSTRARGRWPTRCWPAGAEVVRRAAATWNIPVEVLSTHPDECEAWTAELRAPSRTLLGMTASGGWVGRSGEGGRMRLGGSHEATSCRVGSRGGWCSPSCRGRRRLAAARRRHAAGALAARQAGLDAVGRARAARCARPTARSSATGSTRR